MRLLGVDRPQTVGILHFVWWRALTYAEDGDLSRVDDAEIADWATWTGDPGEFVAALTEAGFLDANRKIHDWYDFAGRWIARREANRERMRRARAPSVPDTNGARTGATGPNLTGPNLTGPLPPTPSRTAGRGAAAPRRTHTQQKSSEPSPPFVSSLTPEEIEEWTHPVRPQPQPQP